MKFNIALVVILLAAGNTQSQTTVPIPLSLEGTTFDLMVQHGTSEIFPGIQTNTIGYNGTQLGPTLILKKGETVTLNVHNQLGDTTTVHWHGLHIAPSNDGSPHNPILAGENWSPSFKVLDHASTYWYHPHPHGKTLNQVVKGAAGFIIVRDEEEAAINLPRTYGVDDVPLVFQWKTFGTDKQIVEMDELDNEVLVNGVLRGATLNLPAQVVRLRLLNGSSHRYFDFGFANNLIFNQIGGDGGLLDVPVSMSKLILSPGERAEILVDLTGKEGQTLTLRQFGSLLPQGYPGGMMMNMGGGNNMMGPLDDTDFDLMTISVTAPTSNPVTNIPATLVSNAPLSQTGATPRSLTMTAQPMMSMTNFFLNGLKFDMGNINFTVEQGKTEVWTLTNQTMMAHPFHLHGNSFWVVSVNGSAPSANMKGRKDVITVPPMNGNIKIVVQYDDFSDPDMPYMYHCHILSHEDNGMMGQFLVTAPSSNTEDLVNNKLVFYPNPSSKTLFFEMDNSTSEGVICQVIDALGQVVLEQSIEVLNGKGSIETGFMSIGSYAVRVLSRSKTYSGIFVKN
ncbi:MAG: multicopper oxidase domain-containing protein [Chitinophagales bacterium]|nr:multicopper oxidase domain-containing protein [Chitinophagales bacterium]